jgi:membrane protein implicated in regulation of membrane protease activity
MNETKEYPPVDSPTLRAHKRQWIWQILVPFLLMMALILAGALLIVLGGETQTRLWADVSLIWLIAPMLALALILAILLGFTIYGLARLLKVTPRFTARAQGIAEQAALGVRRVTDGAAQPFIWVEQAGAAFRSAIAFLLGKKR